MGPNHRVESALTETVRVIPDVPSFAVDDGFVYSVPPSVTLGVGDIVRIPLGGRRVRGWVIGSGGAPGDRRLRAVIGRSGELPVFDSPMLSVMRWAAAHYVAPMSAVLGKVTPPNLPKGRSAPISGSRRGGQGSVRLMVGAGPWTPTIGDIADDLVAAGESLIVVAPSWPEAVEIAGDLRRRFDDRVILGSSHIPAAALTRAWVKAATEPGRIIVGTRDVAWWRAPAVGGAIVVDDGRRGLKEKAMPTVHARDLLAKRSAVERWPLVVCGSVPTPEMVMRPLRVEQVGVGRPWGLVEVVDRRQDPPGTGLFAAVTVAAIRSAVGSGKRVFVLTHRRGGAQRCARCRQLRLCGSCGSSPGTGPACERCGVIAGECAACGAGRFEPLGVGVPRLIAELARVIGADTVGAAAADRQVIVGTERDLVGASVDLAVVADADGFITAPNYRAGEEALRIMARAVAAAGAGRGRRGVVQTMQPEHPVIGALVGADPVPYLRAEGKARSAIGFPPGAEVLVVEATGLEPSRIDELAHRVGPRGTVHGPSIASDRTRWYVQGRDLASARVVIRSLVGEWREAGVRVRVDADPIDL